MIQGTVVQVSAVARWPLVLFVCIFYVFLFNFVLFDVIVSKLLLNFIVIMNASMYHTINKTNLSVERLNDHVTRLIW